MSQSKEKQQMGDREVEDKDKDKDNISLRSQTSSIVIQGGLFKNPTTSLRSRPYVKRHGRIRNDRPHLSAFWLKHYRIVSYIVYGFIASFSLLYLLYVGIHQSNPRMEIQFTTVVRYLEYNSYSLLSPIMCPVLMGLLASYVYKRVKLEEGDFFGLLGVLLFFALVNFHDGYGILQLVSREEEAGDDNTTKAFNVPEEDFNSREDYHWQYAWSTRPTCAKKYVRDLVYQHDFDKKHVRRQVVVELDNSGPRTAAERASTFNLARQCNRFHDSKENAKIREWMRQLQNEFKCCGPYGYVLWKTWFKDQGLTGCDEAWIISEDQDIPNCYGPLTQWLDQILIGTVWIMITQGSLYILSIIFALLHHRAMKLNQATVVKSYSLMSFTDHHLGEEDGRWWLLPRPADDPPVTEGETLEQFHKSRVNLDGLSKAGDIEAASRNLKKLAKLAKMLRMSRSRKAVQQKAVVKQKPAPGGHVRINESALTTVTIVKPKPKPSKVESTRTKTK